MLKIREDNITFETLMEDLKANKISVKEYVTRSEHSNLFTTVINKKVLDSYKNPIKKDLKERKLYKPYITELIKKYAKKDSIVLDIGAI